MLYVRWHNLYSHPEGAIRLGDVTIGRIAWHYRGGRNSMYCLFINDDQLFFSRSPEAVVRKFSRATQLPIITEQ